MPRLLTVLIASASSLLLHIATPAQGTSAQVNKPAPNAAVLYRQALAEIGKAHIDPKTGRSIIPDGYYGDPKSLLIEEWATVVSRSAVGLTLFAQATQTKNCQFADDFALLEIELSGTSSPSYFQLLNAVRAQGWQLVDTHPEEACLVAMRLLNFANHCAANRTQAGAEMHFAADDIAVNLLQAAIPKLRDEHRAIAGQLAAELGTLPKRMTNRDIAAATQHGRSQAIRLAFAVDAESNEAVKPAIERAVQMVREILQPLHKLTITEEAYRAHAKKKLAGLDKVVGDADLTELFQSGKGEQLAAAIVTLVASDSPELWRPHHEHTRALEKAQAQLAKLAGKLPKQDPDPKKQPNAAVLYRQAMQELERALARPGSDGDLDLPEDAYDEKADFCSKAWRDAVRKSGVAISLFGQATQVKACAFDRDKKELVTELVSAILQFQSLRKLVVAHAHQQLENNPRNTALTAMQLLRHANHCAQDQSLMGLAVGFLAETEATALLIAADKRLANKADARLFLKGIEQHLAARPTRATIADRATSEVSFIFANGLGEAKENPALKSACKRALEMHDEILAPLRQAKPVSVQALHAHTKQHIDLLRKLMKAKTVDDVLKNGAGETLAAALLLLCSNDTSRVLEPFVTAEEKLMACKIKLARSSR